jgi:hypothetical protein
MTGTALRVGFLLLHVEALDIDEAPNVGRFLDLVLLVGQARPAAPAVGTHLWKEKDVTVVSRQYVMACRTL